MEIADYDKLLGITGQITIALRFIPALVLGWYWRSFNQPIRLMGYFLIAIIISNLFNEVLYWSFLEYYNSFWKSILMSLNIGDTHFLNIIGRLIDYIFVGWIFSFTLKEPLSWRLKHISWGLIPVAILVYFFVDGFRTYGTVNAILNRVYLVAVPMLYFWYLFNSPPNLSLWRNSFFLFGLGLSVSNLFGIIMSFVGDKLNETDYVAFVKVSIFRNCLTILAQFVFAYAFYQAKYAKYLLK